METVFDQLFCTLFCYRHVQYEKILRQLSERVLSPGMMPHQYKKAGYPCEGMDAVVVCKRSDE